MTLPMGGTKDVVCTMYSLRAVGQGLLCPQSTLVTCALISSAILVSPRQSGADLRDRQIGTPGFTAVKGWDPVSFDIYQSVNVV